MAWYELFTRILRQFTVIDSVSLLFAHDSKGFFITVNRLIQGKGVEAIWLVCHVGSGRYNVIVCSFISENHDASSFEHFQIVIVWQPERAFWTTIEVFGFQGFVPITKFT